MFKKSILAILMINLVVGCGSGDNKNDDKGKSLISLSFKDTGGTEPEYLLQKEGIMSGTISAQGAGFEQTGWNFYYTVGNTLFVSGYKNKETISYTSGEQGKLRKLSTFLFDTSLEMFGNVNNDTLLATTLPRDGAHAPNLLYTVNAKTGKITAKTPYTVFDKDTGVRGKGLVAAPTALQVRDNKLFIAFHKLDDSSPQSGFQTPQPNSAVVAVYAYPLTKNAKPEKIIEDTRTSHIGVNGNTTNMIKLDNDDIYSFSNGSIAAGFNPKSDKPSGLLRIKKGQTDFDKSYFFNVEEATKGGKVFWLGKLTGTKVLARVLMPNEAADKAAWSAFAKSFFTSKLVLLDVAEKTVTDIKGLPLHQKRNTSPIEIINGKVYLSIETKEDAYIYQYDVATNTVKKGAKLLGKTIKGFYDLQN